MWMRRDINEYHYEAVSTEIPDRKESKQERNLLLKQLLVAIPAWMTLFTTGLTFGAPTVFIPQIRREANSTDAVSAEMASWLSSVFSCSAIPFIILVSCLMPIVGRKKPFLFVSLNQMIFNIVLYFGTNTTHYLLSEILQGINQGATLTITLIIVSEYTSPKYRGVFLTMKSATFYWGVWCANAIGTFYHWKYIPLTGMVLALLNIIVFFWPESPYWLASKGRFEECAKSYFWLMGKNETTKKELEHLIESQKEEIKNCQILTATRLVEIITSKVFYKPTLLCIIMMLQYNFTGKVVCSMYAIDIIKKITGSESAAYYGMLLLDGVTVTGMYCGCFLSRVVKRRTQLMTTGTLSIIFLFVLSLYLYYINLGLFFENRYATACLLAGFSLTVAIGPIIMLISVHVELSPLKYKCYCMLIAAVAYHITSGTLLKLSPYIFTNYGMHTIFLFYGVTSGLCLFILYLYLPETKDKTLQEISDMFDDKNS